ncbi:MAG: DUF2905 domain-containing protein [Nitrospinota bacterium]|nr:DUF2905 domain-containing protein [Nitrospinota bacterium]MDH5679573.1 DUF2905 domain-containing protein [Nitrospinota bacterium]MDH5756027.1 DUF2905 domain-containing protein [Nitrospinota bacterium]
MQKLLLFSGLILVVTGLAWPWIQRIGLGRLPGDISWEKEGFSVYVPVGSMILISVLLTVALNILFRLFK